MDPVMAALLFGFLGISIVWTLAKNFSSRWQEKHGIVETEVRAGDADSPEAEAELYRRIKCMRIAAIVLCLAAIAVLYFQLHTALALLMAGIACGLQWYSYQVRSAHLRARSLVPQKKR